MHEPAEPDRGRAMYLVRHCQSSGQAPDAPLTGVGRRQSQRLADALASVGIRRIVASTYLRARQSVEPLAERLGLPLETDARLIERTLAAESLPDWQERIRASFTNLDVALPGGESTAAATRRAMQAIGEIVADDRLPAVVVAHGNLLAAVLHHLDGRPGFETWQALTNPDVFRVSVHQSEEESERWLVERVWTE
jgi:2,3-bisphosphoglycerate-dependent phosphoglycerate mutase